MANTRALVKRRKAIRNIRKITRTMELIATARFKKALDRATEAEAYTRKIAELAADLSAIGERHQASAAGEARPRSRTASCWCSAPIAACAAATTRPSSARPIAALAPACKREGVNVHLELSGKRAIAYFRFQGIPADAHLHALRGQAELRGSRRAGEPLPRRLHRRQDRPRRCGVHEVHQRRQASAGGRDAAAAVVAGAGAGQEGVVEEPKGPVEYEFSAAAPRRSWKRSCRCRSRFGCSSASSTRPSASRSPAASP